MSDMPERSPLIDWKLLAAARVELGASFVRLLGYFREDGVTGVNDIERAMRANDSARLVAPAHRLKGEARQFGAETLADLCETIEVIARNCVESHEPPSAALEHVVRLRQTFTQTLAVLERETSPLVERRPIGFGRRG